jgi:membrane carboxypeptidase/penicillin-binding protein PbpC
VGNADNSKMGQVAGSRGAAPVWHNFMEKALEGQPATPFVRPQGIDEIEISADSGSLPGAACPPDRRRREIFAAGQGPHGPEADFHQWVRIDTTTGARATEYCPANVVEERTFIVLPGAEGQKWAADHGLPQPPAEPCPVHTGPAQVVLLQPLPGETVSEEVVIVGRVVMPDFQYYDLAYGPGQDPADWWLLAEPVYTPVDGGMLAQWDVRSLPDGDYGLRLVAVDRWGNAVEARTWVRVQNADARSHRHRRASDRNAVAHRASADRSSDPDCFANALGRLGTGQALMTPWSAAAWLPHSALTTVLIALGVR